jgi:NADH pyrophosphatase NudC (nudix superfamily)
VTRHDVKSQTSGAFAHADGDALSPYLLGLDGNHWKFALNPSGHQLEEFTAGRGLELVDLRVLMAELPTEELAIAGQAVALSQWHLVLYFLVTSRHMLLFKG